MTKTDLHTTQNNDDCLFCMEHLEEAAMRILEPEIQSRMECHLTRCTMCRDELAHIERSLLSLAYSVDSVDPRPEAKTKLLAAFDTERDQPAVTPSEPVASPKPRLPRHMPWSYGSVFAGLCVALLVIGMWSFLPFESSESGLPGGQIQVMAMDLTCPDCHHETGGQIGADPEEKDGLVMAWNLDPQRKHEVWCVNRDGKHEKVGDLDVADTGSVMQTVSFPDAVGGYQQIYVIRDDGAEELTVAPGTGDDNEGDLPDSPSTPVE